jgi:hypothetical protein
VYCVDESKISKLLPPTSHVCPIDLTQNDTKTFKRKVDATVQLKKTNKKQKSSGAADELGLKVEMGCIPTVNIDPNIESPLKAMKLLQNVNHGHYSVIQINKKQIDYSFNEILGVDNSWHTRSSYIGMHMDDSGVMRHLYWKKKDARRATLLGIILFEKPNTDAMEYRCNFGEKHGVMSQPYTLFRDRYSNCVLL